LREIVAGWRSGARHAAAAVGAAATLRAPAPGLPHRTCDLTVTGATAASHEGKGLGGERRKEDVARAAASLHRVSGDTNTPPLAEDKEQRVSPGTAALESGLRWSGGAAVRPADLHALAPVPQGVLRRSRHSAQPYRRSGGCSLRGVRRRASGRGSSRSERCTVVYETGYDE
jgi:hypothetical protein